MWRRSSSQWWIHLGSILVTLIGAVGTLVSLFTRDDSRPWLAVMVVGLAAMLIMSPGLWGRSKNGPPGQS